jgi:hypothetical protein
LSQGSSWIALDFPFGQPRTLIENLNWPNSWNGYVGVVESMTRQEFVGFLRKYQDRRHKGDKRHFRAVDKKARSAGDLFVRARLFQVLHPGWFAFVGPARSTARSISFGGTTRSFARPCETTAATAPWKKYRIR